MNTRGYCTCEGFKLNVSCPEHGVVMTSARTFEVPGRIRESTVQKKRTVQLLRDRRFHAHPDYKGEPYETARVPNVELHSALLVGKAHQELSEVQASLTEAEEYADVLQTLRDLAQENGVRWDDVERIRIEKEADSGGFSQRAYMWRNFRD